MHVRIVPSEDEDDNEEEAMPEKHWVVVYPVEVHDLQLSCYCVEFSPLLCLVIVPDVHAEQRRDSHEEPAREHSSDQQH